MMKKVLFLFFCLIFSKGYSVGIDYVTPVNNYINPGFTVNFSWNPVLNFTSYRLRIARDAAFAIIVKDTVINNTSLTVSINPSINKVFWQVSLANTSAFVPSDIDTLNFISPSQNPNLLLWLSADSNVVIQPDSALISWTNIIPNGIVATQADPTKKPRLVNNVRDLNNKQAVNFNGVLNSLTTNLGGGPVGNSYVLLNWLGGSTFNNYIGILTGSPTVLGSDYLFETFPGGSGFYQASYYTSNTYINNSLSPTFSPLARYKVLSGRVATATRSYPAFNIGVDAAGGGNWNGNMAEIIVSKSTAVTETDSIHTYLYHKYAPPVSLGKDIVAGTTFSDSIVLDPGGRFVNYLWSNGSTAPTTKVATGGIYSVKTKDIFGFDYEDEVRVYPYKRLNNISIYLCSGDSLVLNLGISNPQFSFSWSTGSTSNKITIKTSGQYTVNITDSRGKIISDTINVFISSPVLTPVVPPSDTLKVCFNEKLVVSSETPFDSIRWSTGNTTNTLPITSENTYSVYAKSVNGCVFNKSFYIKINGIAPVAKFDNTKACQSQTVLFSDSSTFTPPSTITRWRWTFGNGDTANIQNPSEIYTSLGSYPVGLKVTTNQGCSDSIGKTIVVNKRPTVDFNIRLSCEGNPTIFEDRTVPNSAAVSDWAWNFDNLGFINGIQNPSFVFTTAGVYNVILKATNSNGCYDTATRQTIVNTSPVSNFSFDSVCGVTPVTFKYLATVQPPNSIPNINWGGWDFGDNKVETAIKNPQHSYASPGTYDVSLLIISSSGCKNTVIKQVKVYDFPVVDFTVSQTQCTGKEIQFTDISTTPDGTPVNKWNWYFSGQATDTLQNPRYTFNTQGNYTIQLTAKNNVGCSGTKLRSIAVSAPPIPKFIFSPNGFPAPLLVTYTNQSAVNGNYIWDYGDSSPLIQAYNPPKHTYIADGTYPIKLTATDFRGCTDTLTKYILVGKAYLDGVMAAISIIPDGDFYKIQVTIKNNSNVEITALGLSLQLGAGAIIRENWTGSLLPGQTTVYLFTGEIKLSENNQIPVVCASIENVNNNSHEDRLDNNTTCKEVRVGSFDVFNIYPNPTFDNINFGVMLPNDGKVNIRFIDVLGQQMYSKEFDGARGYNNLTMPTELLNAAVYVAEISFDGEIIRKKFMRKDRK